jgi:hypothetical protein
MNEKRTRIQASQLGVPVTVHACQSEYEVANVVDRYGKTPIAWIRDIGFLRDNVILDHALYLSGTKWTGHPAGDIEAIAEAGASVAHAPWVFGRDGMALRFEPWEGPESWHLQRAGQRLCRARTGRLDHERQERGESREK